MIELTTKTGRQLRIQATFVGGDTSGYLEHRARDRIGRDELLKLLKLVPSSEFIEAPVISRWTPPVEHSET